MEMNCPSDSEFVAMVTSYAANIEAIDGLAAALRTRYPNAVVRLRNIDGELDEVWYVYRDGRWVSESGQVEGRSG